MLSLQRIYISTIRQHVVKFKCHSLKANTTNKGLKYFIINV